MYACEHLAKDKRRGLAVALGAARRQIWLCASRAQRKLSSFAMIGVSALAYSEPRSSSGTTNFWR